MRRVVLCLCTMLGLFAPNLKELMGASETVFTDIMGHKLEENFGPMIALDQVKEQYAANFMKVYTDISCEEYYYELPFADYYLVYEGMGGTERQYLFHLYEFVQDEPDTGIGHTVTYGWYMFNMDNGEITDQIQ